jgi:hypothetical protein
LRALLKPVIIPELGLVAFRRLSQLLPHFHRGMLIENEPERLPICQVVKSRQQSSRWQKTRHYIRYSLTRPCYASRWWPCGLEDWLLRDNSCQWPHEPWHMESITTMRHAPGAIRLCWHCDNLRDQQSSALESSPWRTVTSSQRFAVNWGLMIPTH